MSRSSLSNLVLRVRVIPCTLNKMPRSSRTTSPRHVQTSPWSHDSRMTCIDYVIWNMDGERKYKHGQWGKRFPSFGRWCLLCHLSAWFWGALKKYKFLDNLNPACTCAQLIFTRACRSKRRTSMQWATSRTSCKPPCWCSMHANLADTVMKA